MLSTETLNDIRLQRFSSLHRIPHFIHWISLRQSTFPPEQANLELCRRHCIPPSRLVLLRQVHGNRVTTVPQDVPPRSFPEATAEADGLILTEPGRFGVIRTADCVPILAVSPDPPAVALLHGGWRSLAGRLVERGLGRLLQETGVAPEDVTVAVGPCIRACCYQVGSDVPAAFSRAGYDPTSFLVGDRFDLVSAVREQAGRLGIHNLLDSGMCTFDHPNLYYSYRRDKTSQRLWTVAGFRSH